MKKVDRKTLEVVLFCPGCSATDAVRIRPGQGAESLCGPCHARFSRWAGERMRDPSAQAHALATWVRLSQTGCLP